jgi:hypothetical protein
MVLPEASHRSVRWPRRFARSENKHGVAGSLASVRTLAQTIRVSKTKYGVPESLASVRTLAHMICAFRRRHLSDQYPPRQHSTIFHPARCRITLGPPDVRPGSVGSSVLVQHLRAACARDAGAARTILSTKIVRSPHAKPHCRTDRARFCEAAGPSDQRERSRSALS